MNKNKKSDMTPFDMKKKPCKQSPLLLPVIWGAAYILTRRFNLKIDKKGIKGIKPPYLVISTHQGYSDYYIAPLSVFPRRASYVSDMEGFAAFGNLLYRKVGCIGKRRFVSDFSVLSNIKYALHHNKNIVFIFPEARHSNDGTTSLLPDNLGRLVKYLDVPVVLLTVHGSYLASPFWDEEHKRKTRVEAKAVLLYDKESVKAVSEKEIQAAIENGLQYDEYKWQYDNKIKIRCKNGAKGLSKVLYKCLKCGSEFTMGDEGNRLFCKQCGSQWTLSEYGQLLNDKTSPVHIPKWYRWERESIIWEITDPYYREEFTVTVEALPNEKGFVNMGGGKLTHTQSGFALTCDKLTSPLFFSSENLPSVQTEYNYKGRGCCIILSTRDCCYYVYSKDRKFNPTKLQFAAEEMHRIISEGKQP